MKLVTSQLVKDLKSIIFHFLKEYFGFGVFESIELKYLLNKRCKFDILKKDRVNRINSIFSESMISTDINFKTGF